MSDLAKQIADELRKQQMTHPAAEPKGPSEKFRASLQGMTFGGADEAEAWLRSQVSKRPYEEILKEVRGKLADYRGAKPWEALGYEAGGAAIPAIAGALFTGGGSTAAASARFFPTLAKMAGLGMAEGGAYAFNAGEGGAMNRAMNMPQGIVAGGVGGAAGYGAVRGGGKVLGGLLDYVNRASGQKAARRVEDELRRVVADSGLTMDEVLARVQSGELIPEMSKTLRSTARGYFAQSRGAAAVLEDTYKTRPDALRKETMDYLQTKMAGGNDNILRRVQESDEALRGAASDEYNAVFGNAAPLGDDLVGSLKDALSRVPEAGDDVKRIYRAETGKTPFFDVTKEGDVVFNRPPTLQDAEIIRRGIKDATDRQYRTGAAAVGSAYKSVERGLRSGIDAASEPLKNVRGKWSNLETAKSAFEEGRKALTKSPDEVEIIFERMTRGGDMETRAFRAGVADAFRRKSATGSRKSIPRNIASDEAKEGAVLRIVFPEDDLNTLLGKAQRATGAQDAANDILGGSQTAITAGRQAQSGGMLSDAVEAGMGNSFALIRLGSQVLKSLQPSLTDKDVVSLAKLMVETNPHVLRQALTDTTALQQVTGLAQNVLANAARPAGFAGGAAGAPAGETVLRQLGR